MSVKDTVSCDYSHIGVAVKEISGIKTLTFEPLWIYGGTRTQRSGNRKLYGYTN